MVSREESRWVILATLVLLILTTLPYLMGYYLQGEAWRFTGFIFGVEDGNSYIAKMLAGANGAWLFRTPYTAYPQRGTLVFLPYLLLGKLTSPPGQHEQLVFWFQGFRWAAVLGYAWAVYFFAAIFIKEISLRRLATMLSLCGGGIGFLAVFGLRFSGFDGLPLEFYSPETFGFLSVLGLPHLAAARAFMLMGLSTLILKSPEGSIWRTGTLAGISWLLLGLMQPVTVLVTWLIAFTALAVEFLAGYIRTRDAQGLFSIRWRSKAKATFVAVLISAVIPLYAALTYFSDPFVGGWMSQNLILSPPPTDYLWAFILVLPFSIAGIIYQLKTNYTLSSILAAWVFLFPVLAYAPLNLQRRLPDGIWVVLSILAVSSLANPGMRIWKRLTPVLYFTFLSSMVLFLGLLMVVLHPSEPLYRPAEEVQAFQFLASQSDRQVVLAGYETSNALPAWAYVRTLIGHGPESVNLGLIQPKVEALLKGTLDDGHAIDLMNEFNVNFVLAGNTDDRDTLSEKPYLEKIYETGGYAIFRVLRIAD